MDDLLETIRAALRDGATETDKRAGVDACRVMLTILDVHHTPPIEVTTVAASDGPAPGAVSGAASDGGAAPEAQSAAPPSVPLDAAAIVGALRGVPPEQLLDLAIERLRAALPAGTAAPRVEPLKLSLIPIAPLAGLR